jgi:uncharacterized protein (TIGR02145 family)
MKTRFDYRNLALALTGLIILLAAGCKKDEKETLPVLTTSPVTYISEQSVSIAGIVTDDGGESITERGICWSTSHNPTTANDKIIGFGQESFTCTLDGLITNTQYYVRAYAINSAGIAYGPEISFRTWNILKVIDLDDNLYHTVTIGTQMWLVENLNVTHYRNGDAIQWKPDNAEWESLTTGAFVPYDNNSSYSAEYGKLYNWFAVNDDRNIAPVGWHVSTDDDWTELADYLGDNATAGGKLKEAGLEHWLEPNLGATNETGFSALPGGFREYGGNFDYINWGGGWWTSTEDNPNDAWIRYLDYGATDVWRALEDKRYGRSVRCVKD